MYETRTGRFVTAASTENSAALRTLCLIREEALMIVEQVQNVLGIESAAADLILQKHSGVC